MTYFSQNPAPEGLPFQSPSLATQVQHAAGCVLAVEQGHSLSEVMPRVQADLRPGVQALTFHVLRNLGAARAMARLLAQRAPTPPVLALLHSALAVLIADEDGARYQTHTVVDQTVQAAKLARPTRMQAGFLNACLRRYLREREALHARLEGDLQVRWNHPLWWIQRLQRDHPKHWPTILRANNQPGPMSLRVNRRHMDRKHYQALLTEQGWATTLLGVDGLVLDAPQPVQRLPGFLHGTCSVQDGAAQMAAGLLLQGRRWSKADRVLDACAAPGGKTAHLLELAELDLLALDLDAQRCERITDNLERLGLHAEVRCADASAPATWWDGRPFDAILLDAPCTASGIVRRHPDVRWLRRASDVDQLVAVQKRLMEALWPLLKPGGRLLYATCSVFTAEGAEQAQAFLERHTDAQLQPSPGHLLPGSGMGLGEFNDNRNGGNDGFYYARIDKALA